MHTVRFNVQKMPKTLVSRWTVLNRCCAVRVPTDLALVDRDGPGELQRQLTPRHVAAPGRLHAPPLTLYGHQLAAHEADPRAACAEGEH